MGLDEYIKKRDFVATPEPEAIPDLSDASRFVIQRHDATRLHYDLRLEIDGVLKSWAVPKGPSMNPKDKRLAIQTEDHPVKYLTFEGVIPKGNYGAGVMNIWDEGRFAVFDVASEGTPSEQCEKGNLKLEFFGKKIKGKFALVRTSFKGSQPQWLLIKKQDEFATKLAYDAEAYATSAPKKQEATTKKLNTQQLIKPMLADTCDEIFADSEWIYELKWDGYRMITHIIDSEVSMYSRNGISFKEKFSPLLIDLENISHDVILDGEVVVLNDKGLSEFQQLQNYDPETTKGHLIYYVFDVLYLNGHDTKNLPLVDRKSLLPSILEDLKSVKYCDHIERMGPAFYQQAIEKGMEGVIAKKADSLYHPRQRSRDWLKIKAIESTEAIICGYTESEGRGKLFGSLILGSYENNELTYIGNCGSGFTEDKQKELMKIFDKLTLKENPFSKKINLKGKKPHWLQPELICEVTFTEWTKDKSMRHPVFKGLREDKLLTDINVEATKAETLQKPYPQPTGDSTLVVDEVTLHITNLDKVYWPESDLKKYDLLDYYMHISETILPYLKGRPQNLHRHPNGINEEGFYQKDNEHLPSWAATKSIYSESSNKDIEYLLCENEAALLYMANLGCIEINPWNSRVENLDSPDYTVIDIDPAENHTFNQVIQTALVAKEVLEKAGVQGYPKTTGKSGLHIYIPLGSNYTYDEARDFTKLLCYYIHEQLPKLTSMERNIKKRNGKIYLDYLQNRRGQTLAAPYCVRPVKGATVSTPVSWKELKDGIKVEDYTIKTIPGRIKEVGDLFAPILSEGINMQQVLENLNQFN